MAKCVTVNEVLDGQAVLDLQCLDRIYLDANLPNLQFSGQVVSFLAAHLRLPISPAIDGSGPGSGARSPASPMSSTSRWCASPRTTGRST
jgi:hypothetical protein